MELALFVLRVVVGLFFVGHGAQKLFGSFGGHGLAGTARFFDSIGMRPGRRNAIAAGVAELGGGLLLLLGLLTPLAAVALIATMLVAIFTVHVRKGPWLSDGGWEYNAVVVAIAFAVAAAGPGEVSLDHALGWASEISGTGWAFGALLIATLGALFAMAAARAIVIRESGHAPEPATAPGGAAAARAQRERPGVPADVR